MVKVVVLLVKNITPPEIIIAARGAWIREKSQKYYTSPEIVIAARGARIRKKKSQKY